MAHKKGGGSSRNGRDSNSQRLGVKRFGGQAPVTASGDYNVIGFDEELIQKYSAKDATREKLLEEIQ